MSVRTLRGYGFTAPILGRNTGGPSLRDRTLRRLASAFAALLAWQGRAQERSALRSIDEHQLRDVGLTRADIQGELDKPVWRRRCCPRS